MKKPKHPPEACGMRDRTTPEARRTRDRYPANNRSKVTNGKILLPVDMHSRWGRRWRDLYQSYAQRCAPTVECDQLCRSLASATLRREQLDCAIVEGRDVDAIALTRLSSLIARLQRSLNTHAIAEKEEGPIDPLTYARNYRSRDVSA